MNDLHIFEFCDGCDYVIAESEADARDVFRAYYGNPEDRLLDDKEIAAQIESVYSVPDDKPFKVWWNAATGTVTDDGGDGELLAKLPSEWAAMHGRGWFCSTEW